MQYLVLYAAVLPLVWTKPSARGACAMRVAGTSSAKAGGIDAYAERDQEVLAQHLTRMYRPHAINRTIHFVSMN